MHNELIDNVVFKIKQFSEKNRMEKYFIFDIF